MNTKKTQTDTYINIYKGTYVQKTQKWAPLCTYKKIFKNLNLNAYLHGYTQIHIQTHKYTQRAQRSIITYKDKNPYMHAYM